MASQLPPTAILRGIDISADLFPKSLPWNVSFSQCSVTNLPTAWAGTFHFVRQHLLATALAREEWSEVLRGSYRVLSPGGWVQLSEVAGWYAGPATTRLWSAVVKHYEIRGIDLQIVDSLPNLLEEAGFINIKIEKRSIALFGSSVRQAKARHNSKLVFRSEYKDALQLELGESFGGLLAAAEKEWNSMSGAEQVIKIVYAQKPQLDS